MTTQSSKNIDVKNLLNSLKKQLDESGEITLSVRVTPKSGKQEVASIMVDGTIKIKLRSAPEGNKANEELIEFLSEIFGIKTNQVTLMSGQTSRKKMVRITLANSKQKQTNSSTR